MSTKQGMFVGMGDQRAKGKGGGGVNMSKVLICVMQI
jgi:hypothetical protein